LGIVVLVEALIGAVFHNARVRIGEIVLILIARSLHERLRHTAPWLFPAGLGFGRTRSHFLIIFRFFSLITGLCPLLKHHLRLRQLALAGLAPSDFVC